jgi:PIN domain-containing protein
VSYRAARVRFYIDADIRGFAQVIAGLRNDVTYPGDPGAIIHKRERPPCTITGTELLDTEWIPEVARRGWLIVTRDNKIAENRSEITAVRENNAKMAALNQRDAVDKWGQLEVFMTQWRFIESLTEQPGPFIWRVSRTAVTQIPLE